MAAKNGGLKTLLYVLLFVILAVVALLVLIVFSGQTSSPVTLDPGNTLHPRITEFHDHRL